ncbi:phosphatase PAP2 family protein [Clostridium sp. MSJ-4]|uniref:Phosphatase PAP2 family protein n=1 Tax=Clostridium simiarum TaxID=2841506 RepID=A0ABS6F0J2_9CLOT|nr:phosphatase PAP2 family protein [Clostridium simiarum]MBU5592022.1 phosphatase PAP2 family protein [Clostridium simiarum]
MNTIIFLQSFSNGFLDNFFIFLTMLGEEYLSIFIMLYLFWCVNKDLGYKLGFSILFSTVTNGAIKDTVKAIRPIGNPLIRSLRENTATGYSFPSGHTQTTTSLWFSLMLVIRKFWFYIFATLLIFLVGISRLYLGVHWPLDVLGGLAFGVISVIVGNYLFALSKKKNNKFILLILILPSLIGLILFPSTDYAKAVGGFTGFFIGYVIESTYINFSINKKPLNTILKLLVGLTSILAIKSGLKIILPATNLSDFFRYLIVCLWITAIAPWIFKKLGL